MAEQSPRFHLETAVGYLKTGRTHFDDLVQGSQDQLVETCSR